MKELLGVTLGGGFGTLLRFSLCNWTKRCFGAGFPVGTLAVNVLGGFLIGLIAAQSLLDFNRHPSMRTTLIVGCLGGFTTFSAFSLETFHMAAGGNNSHALLNAVGNVVLALGATWLGVTVGGKL
jgi:CrcB protein